MANKGEKTGKRVHCERKKEGRNCEGASSLTRTSNPLFFYSLEKYLVTNALNSSTCLLLFIAQ